MMKKMMKMKSRIKINKDDKKNFSIKVNGSNNDETKELKLYNKMV
jgi:hypothetical protein